MVLSSMMMIVQSPGLNWSDHMVTMYPNVSDWVSMSHHIFPHNAQPASHPGFLYISRKQRNIIIILKSKKKLPLHWTHFQKVQDSSVEVKDDNQSKPSWAAPAEARTSAGIMRIGDKIGLENCLKKHDDSDDENEHDFDDVNDVSENTIPRFCISAFFYLG